MEKTGEGGTQDPQKLKTCICALPPSKFDIILPGNTQKNTRKHTQKSFENCFMPVSIYALELVGTYTFALVQSTVSLEIATFAS